jgi:hypothetical protein
MKQQPQNLEQVAEAVAAAVASLTPAVASGMFEGALKYGWNTYGWQKRNDHN